MPRKYIYQATLVASMLFGLLLSAAVGCAAQKDRDRGTGVLDGEAPASPEELQSNNILGSPNATELSGTGKINIRQVGEFDFQPARIQTVRSDIFRSGYFSIFDILVHLDERGAIDMSYHFDMELNTHVIDTLNGEEHWWYRAYYHMGWGENNAYRMDHFPYKDDMTISIGPVNESYLDEVYDVFRDEVERKNRNDGRIIILEVFIRGPGTRLELKNVEVTSHNLRDDIFQDDVITAIDVIMSLGETGELSYDLKWYENIGSAVIKQYFVERINNDVSFNRCGFVYEEGSHAFGGFRGNHIHLPSDTRVLNSPEYLSYFWICI
jgi:hypothetical protein